MTWFFLIVMAAVAVAPFWFESRRPRIGKTARKGAPGKFARLSQGVTYYRWYGPVRGPVIVAVHGLTTPSIVWHVIAEGLGRLGYRVMVYDLYGRGLSDAPAGPQDADFFERQLADLLADQNLDEQVALMGFSMGGAIVTAFAARRPHLVSRLILLAPSGIEVNESDFSGFCRKVPWLGDWALLALGRRRMEAAIKADDQTYEVDGIQRAQAQELHRRGYMPAVLSSRRGLLAESLEAAHRTVSREDIPVIAIWGGRDQIIPMAALGQLAQWNRMAKQEVIEEADHSLPYAEGTAVVEILRSVLAERDR